jgi:hypothetical protein
MNDPNATAILAEQDPASDHDRPQQPAGKPDLGQAPGANRLRPLPARRHLQRLCLFHGQKALAARAVAGERMRTVIHDRYGPPDVLQLADVEWSTGPRINGLGGSGHGI